MAPEPKTPTPMEDEPVVSRRALAKKVAYVAPAVLAVIVAAERPALASSGSPVPN